MRQTSHKPDSVEDDHLSGTDVAIDFKRHYRQNTRATPLSGSFGSLAADGVYLSPRSPGSTVRSCRTRFTLTRTIMIHTGGIVSVALSLQLPAVAVSNRPALRCPDFPHALSDARSSSDLTRIL